MGRNELFSPITKVNIAGVPLAEVDRFDEAELRVESTTIMFADVVESVRLIEQDEARNVVRIRNLLRILTSDIQSRYGGRVLERRGDGLLVRFEHPHDACSCAVHFHDVAVQASVGFDMAAVLALRVGLHSGPVYSDGAAVYGSAINLAARIAAMAGPGETVASAATRDQLVGGLDGDLEDLGECYFKHVDSHLRMFRVHRAQNKSGSCLPERPESVLRPTLIVSPPSFDEDLRQGSIIGEVLADGLISAIGMCRDIRVISRLSSTNFRQDLQAARAEFVATGASYCARTRLVGSIEQLVLVVELIYLSSGAVVWSGSYRMSVADLLGEAQEVVTEIAGSIAARIGVHTRIVSACRPLSNLDSSELMYGAIALTHRTSLNDFDRPRALLEQVIERHSRVAAPRAWLAHWYVLRAVQGLSDNAKRDAEIALSATRRALDCDPRNSLALATQGFAYCHLAKDLDQAEKSYRAALSINPSDAFAWIYLAALHAFRSEGQLAEDAAAEAIRCSPIDPRRHFFDAIAATAAFTNFRYEAAITSARRSLLGDRYHASTLRTLAMSLAQLGRVEEGRIVANELLTVEPTLSIRSYLRRTPSADFEVGARCAASLRLVGIPE